MAERDELLGYFEQELAHLRKMGGEFARRYPKVASRLELSGDHCSDPYVERLIESFAYLTSRIRYNLDRDFPEIPSALLGLLYPHYLNPTPSMTIVRFDVDPTRGKLTSGYTIARGTQLFAESHQGIACRFKTAYPVTLWPVTVTEAAFETRDQFESLELPGTFASALRVRIAGTAGPLDQLDLSRLRFYLDGESSLVYKLHRMLLSECVSVALVPYRSRRPIMLPPGSVSAVGFGADEDVIPYPRQSLPQYRLLKEYFAFPEKFLFFDVAHLDRHASRRTYDIMFLFDRIPDPLPAVSCETFALGCTPAVNLFNRISEPVRLTHLRSEYPLVADKRRETSTEIHSIERVTATAESGDDADVMEPYFSLNHSARGRGNQAYWYARRVPSERVSIPGTEMQLSIVDPSFRPTMPAMQTVFAHLVCTNRGKAGELPSGAGFQMEDAAPVAAITAIIKPTRQQSPPLGGATYWRLVSQLSLNHLSLTGGEASLRALQEILRLYAVSEDPSHQMQILGMVALECRSAVRRIGKQAWRGFVGGTEISVTFDEDKFVGGSAYLMASVLNHFFALHTSINSFTQLSIRNNQQERIVASWPPMVGAQNVL